MIDLHSHILPGVDDGSATLQESLEIANAAVEDGIELVAATPHVRDDYPTPVATMELLVDELRAAFQRERIPLELRPGGEIAVEQLEVLSPDELRRFGLAGNPRFYRRARAPGTEHGRSGGAGSVTAADGCGSAHPDHRGVCRRKARRGLSDRRTTPYRTRARVSARERRPRTFCAFSRYVDGCAGAPG
jgi:hypothetical protein